METWQHADASGRSISDRLRLMLRMLARIAMMAAKIAVMLALPFPWRLSKQVADDAADAGGSGRGDQNELQLMLMMLFSFGCGNNKQPPKIVLVTIKAPILVECSRSNASRCRAEFGLQV